MTTSILDQTPNELRAKLPARADSVRRGHGIDADNTQWLAASSPSTVGRVAGRLARMGVGDASADDHDVPVSAPRSASRTAYASDTRSAAGGDTISIDLDVPNDTEPELHRAWVLAGLPASSCPSPSAASRPYDAELVHIERTWENV